MLYCPIDDSASCARSTDVSKVLDATRNGTRTSVSLKPKLSAVARILATPVDTPSLANTVLHDRTNASRTVAFSQPLAPLISRVVVPGRVYGSGESVGSSRLPTTPASSAAAAVTTLNVDPGGYVRCTARFSIGRSGSAFSRAQVSRAVLPFPDSSAGSYDGTDTSARILPVDGSTAATAPLRRRSPSYAARCAAGSIVVSTWPPGLRDRVNSFHIGRGASSGAAPDSSPSSVRSSSVVPYSCEAKPVTGAYNGPSWYVRS